MVCRNETRTECIQITEKKCETQYESVTKDECKTVPDKECHTLEKNVCKDFPETVCEIVNVKQQQNKCEVVLKDEVKDISN